MLYVGHAQLPTSVRHAIKCSFLEPQSQSLVLVKHSQIEIYAIEPDQLNLLHTLPVFGLIEHIQSYIKPPNQTATILVLTSELNLFTLRYSPQTKSVITTATISLNQPGARPADYLQTSIVDPHSRCLVLHALNGILHLIPLEPSSKPRPKHLDPSLGSRRKRSTVSLKSDPTLTSDSDINIDPDSELYQIVQLRLNEVNVHALDFAALPAHLPPTLLILYSNHMGQRVLRSRSIDLLTANCDQEICPNHLCPDPDTGLIIPIPDDQGSVLLVGEESVELVYLIDRLPNSDGKGKSRDRSVDSRTGAIRAPEFDKLLKHVTNINIPLGSYTCFCKVEDQPDVWLIGDLYGHVLVIRLERPEGGKPVLRYQQAGQVSSPEALVYISDRFIYLASHYGDSQLLRVSALDSALAQDSQPEVVANYPNLAPIYDVCVVDPSEGFDHQLVTCSGAYQDGSLRIITHGITLTDLGMLPITGAEHIWSIDTPHSSQVILIVGFRNQTRFLTIQNDQFSQDIEELDRFSGFKSDRRTILAGRIITPGHRIQAFPIQVTQEEVIVGEMFRWEPRSNDLMTVAAIGASLTVVALQREVLLLHVKDDLLVQSESIRFPSEVSCLAIDPSQKVLAVGQWISNSIALVSLDQMTVATTIETGSDFGVHSILFSNFGEGIEPHLLAGMDNGELISIKLQGLEDGSLVQEKSRRTVVLGRRPITMAQIVLDTPTDQQLGRPAIWIHSEHPTLMIGVDGRLQFKPVALGNGTDAIKIGMRGVGVVTSEGIRLGRIDSLENIHISKIPLGGEQPKRIAHSKAMRAFGVVCVSQKVNQETGELDKGSSVKIIDDVTFELLFDFQLLSIEQGTSIAAIELGEGLIEDFIIGTGFIHPNESQSNTGRILTIGLSSNQEGHSREFKLKRMTKVKGTVHGLGGLPGGKFVASANAFVHAFGIQEDPSENEGFQVLDTWGGGFVSQTLLTEGNWVIVGDLYKSIVILEFDLKKSSLKVLGRDYSVMSVKSIGMMSDRVFVGADTEFNLFTVEMKEKRRIVEEEEEEEDEEEEERGDEWEEEERKMRVEKVFNDDHLLTVGAFHLGENVNHFKKGSLIKSLNHLNQDSKYGGKLIFVTSTGGIGVIIKIEDTKLYKRLKSLEDQMKTEITSIGGLDSIEFRKFKNKWKRVEVCDFLDGDLVQRYHHWFSKKKKEIKFLVRGEEGKEEKEEEEEEGKGIDEILEELSWFH
ncbi:CPSF A subunit region-domain-containing protein [Melampsora americana]|nr:CPSF A subunit region-domain-containing protein [Melampsora americana]